ncbi:helix-turn-helix domain-containing protein [Dongia rigui]|uniref:Helix-turn-helix domain-containing protein n=1 Tax=Dongia rigui TaxID=940149 RepID=A0ABU5E0K4_9PROT|nr:helix-turn-helix domain-containing protein [Dongia rigui]MDY0873113.1 helix-turn-helix domain-containing protein [Dongia rigui]
MTGRFARLPAAAVSDRRLSGDDLRALCAIAIYVNRKGTCWVSTERLAQDLGLHRRSIQRHVKRLIDLGYLRKEQGFDTSLGYRRRFLSVLYPEVDDAEVRPHSDADASADQLGSSQGHEDTET